MLWERQTGVEKERKSWGGRGVEEEKGGGGGEIERKTGRERRGVGRETGGRRGKTSVDTQEVPHRQSTSWRPAGK